VIPPRGRLHGGHFRRHSADVRVLRVPRADARVRRHPDADGGDGRLGVPERAARPVPHLRVLGEPLFEWLAAVPLVAALDPVGLQEALFAATGFTGYGSRGRDGDDILAGSPPRSGSGCCSPRDFGPAVSVSHPCPTSGSSRTSSGWGSLQRRADDQRAGDDHLTAMIVTFSPPVVAAYGPGNRLISLVFLPAMGLRARDRHDGRAEPRREPGGTAPRGRSSSPPRPAPGDVPRRGRRRDVHGTDRRRLPRRRARRARDDRLPQSSTCRFGPSSSPSSGSRR